MIINQIFKIVQWWIIMKIRIGVDISLFLLILFQRSHRNHFYRRMNQRNHQKCFHIWSSSSCYCSLLLIFVCDGRLSLGDWLVLWKHRSAFSYFPLNMGCCWTIFSGRIVTGSNCFGLWTARHVKVCCFENHFHVDPFHLQNSGVLASDSSGENCWESILPGNDWRVRFDPNWEIDFFAQNPAQS